MTTQVSSHLTLHGESYSITEQKPHPIFHPKSLGLEVSPIGTWCWAGYMVSYEYKDDQLFARSMNLGLGPNAPLIYGVAPADPYVTPDGYIDMLFGQQYKDVWVPIDYTGKLILGREWIANLGRGHHGAAPAVEFEVVREVYFEKGCVVRNEDLSQQYEEERRPLIEKLNEEQAERAAKEEKRRRRERWRRKIISVFSRKRKPMATHTYKE